MTDKEENYVEAVGRRGEHPRPPRRSEQQGAAKSQRGVGEVFILTNECCPEEVEKEKEKFPPMPGGTNSSVGVRKYVTPTPQRGTR